MKAMMFVAVVCICVFDCSSGPEPVYQSNEFGTSTNNDNVSCVVNSYAVDCDQNSWTYDNGRSCSNTGTCKTGDVCMLWNNETGTCQPNQ
jgi:hypothetical protein